MRPLACSLALLLLASSAALAAGAPAAKPHRAQTPRKKIDKSPAKAVPDREVKITSETFEILAGSKQASWKGNVVVLRDDMRVQCRALLADYDDQKRLKRLTCSGDAYMRQAAKANRPEREVWGEVAVFENDTAVLTVTGSPRGREGENTMQGEKITFDSNADKLRVERATVVIQTPPDKNPLAPKPAPGQEPPR